jgi:hypothetical protein
MQSLRYFFYKERNRCLLNYDTILNPYYYKQKSLVTLNKHK